ncbi:MAG: hypothetical protein IPL59_11430 [Candidatus Competibacteraceae bacterium]|nr:hypothetical protein [Candidatus Competibacteraceae bacterium]
MWVLVLDRWQAMAGSGAKLTAELVHYLIPLRDWALGRAAGLGNGILSLSLGVFICFSTGTAGALGKAEKQYSIESVESRPLG